MDTVCRVLVVEDEYIMQQGIKYLVDWGKEGFEIAGIASNGKEALELVDKLHPHIVLTDVVMPVMNGVELTAALRDTHPEVQVVVISGYSDFEYVRATFQGGAVDYILKPTLNPQILLETMKRAAGRIPNMSLQAGKGTPESCLGRVLAGFQSENEIAVLRSVMPENAFLLIGEHIGRIFGSDKAAAQRQKSLLKQSVQKELAQFPHLQIVTEEGVLLLAVNFPIAQQPVVVAAADRAIQSVARGEPRTFFVCSPVFYEIGQLREVYTSPFLRRTERFFYYQETHFLMRSTKKADHTPRLDTNRFSMLINDARMDDALALLCDYVDAAALVYAPEESELKNTVQSALYQIIIRLEDLGLDADELSSLKRDSISRLQSAPWLESFAQTLVGIVTDINAILENYSIGKTSDVMRDILAYIDTHYADAITLRSVSSQFNFSYSYLSSFFHSHYQEGFNDYLNRVRVRHAAELLRSGAAVSDVCGKVGYGDQSHFTKIFKKYTGHTPGAYRRAAGREGSL